MAWHTHDALLWGFWLGGRWNVNRSAMSKSVAPGLEMASRNVACAGHVIEAKLCQACMMQFLLDPQTEKQCASFRPSTRP
eukprot:364772-Chlamydomonas_euryale.AAC.14